MMNSIDLIPASYRDRLWRRRWLSACALVTALVVLGGAAAKMTFASLTDSVRDEIRHLQEQQTLIENKQAEIASLKRHQEEYGRQLRLLEQQRSGIAIETLFLAIDGALRADEVWLDTWDFQRSTESNANNAMRIGGQALDHAALSRFVQGMLSHSGIEDVRIKRTSQREYTRSSAINFDLDVVLKKADKP